MKFAAPRKKKFDRFPSAKAVLASLEAHPHARVLRQMPDCCPLAKCTGYYVDSGHYYLTGDDLSAEQNGRRLPPWAVRFVAEFDSNHGSATTAKVAAKLLRGVLKEKRR